jgi:hypothetical protein
MNSVILSGRAAVSVEHFIRPLSLPCLPVPAGWIEGREENDQCAGRTGSRAKRAGNAGKQIFDLLFICSNALVFNGCVGLLDTVSGPEAAGLAGFGQGGRGSRALAGGHPLNTSGRSKFVHIALGALGMVELVAGFKNKKGGGGPCVI